MKLTVRIALLLGLGLMAALIMREGASSIMDLLARAGWVLLLLVPLHVLPLFPDVVAWRLLILEHPPNRRPGLGTLFWMATIREAVNRLLPVANIGGEVVGIRMLVLRGVQGPIAGASIILEVLLTIVGQYVFVAIGVVCLLKLIGAVALVGDLLIGLAVSLPVLALLFALFRYGSVFERIERLAVRVFGAESQALSFLGNSASLDAAIRELYRHRARLVAAASWQLTGMIASSLETWLALRWLGHPVNFATAMVLESLTQAARHFVFMVPAGLGVQEAGLVGFGYLLGLGSDAAIALSLAKRMREILFGLPALLSWYWMDGRPGLRLPKGVG